MGNRLSEDALARSACESLDHELGPSLPRQYSLVLTLAVPVQHGGRFRKALRKLLEETILPRGPFVERRYFPAGDAIVGIAWIPRRASGEHIVGVVQNTDSNPDILLNATVILAGRIREKEQRRISFFKNLPVDEFPWWLLLINDYPLADAETYSRALRAVSTRHCFERIYIVMDANQLACIQARLEDT